MLAILAFGLAAGCRGPATPEHPVAGGVAARAPKLMQEYGCAGCHTIPGVPGATGRVGPPLVAMADRAYVAGVLPNTPESLVRWIRYPTHVNPRTAMPDMAVSEQDARDMAAYLATLRGQPRAVRMLQGFVERAMGRQIPEPLPLTPVAEPES